MRKPITKEFKKNLQTQGKLLAQFNCLKNGKPTCEKPKTYPQ